MQHDYVALLLDRRVVVALAHLVQRRIPVVRLIDLDNLTELRTYVRRHLVEQRNRTDLEHIRSRRAGVFEDTAEDQQEHQRKEDREEQRGPISKESEGHRPR